MPSQVNRRAIPWITQYATPTLIRSIAYEGHPAWDDPNWRLTGAPSQEIYGRWCGHLCGMACLRMVLFARDGQAPSIFALLDGCLRYGGYREEPDGQIKGLFYQPFVDFVRDRYKLEAEVITQLDADRLVREFGMGRLVIASVHREIRRPEVIPPKTGGHLVLVTERHNSHVTFYIPSGHTAESGVARLATETFDRFAAHRGIALRL